MAHPEEAHGTPVEKHCSKLFQTRTEIKNLMVEESKRLVEINNFIWSPPDSEDDDQKIMENVRSQLLLHLTNRDRKSWTRSPLNVATHKMRPDVVRMMVREADIDVNSVDEIKDCQRSALTVAISRARVNPEKSLEMIKILTEELKANVNETLLWKSSSSQETKEFTPLIWAVLQNQPGIVQFLLDMGADEAFWGCCLGKSKEWLCGTALGIAQEIQCDESIIEMLESRAERKISNVMNTTVIQVGSKPNWKSLIDPTSNKRFMLEIEKDARANSAIQMQDNISRLVSNPNYLNRQQIEEEKRELMRRAEALEMKIKVSAEIEEQIRLLKQQSPLETDLNSARPSSVSSDD